MSVIMPRGGSFPVPTSGQSYSPSASIVCPVTGYNLPKYTTTTSGSGFAEVLNVSGPGVLSMLAVESVLGGDGGGVYWEVVIDGNVIVSYSPNWANLLHGIALGAGLRFSQSLIIKVKRSSGYTTAATVDAGVAYYMGG